MEFANLDYPVKLGKDPPPYFIYTVYVAYRAGQNWSIIQALPKSHYFYHRQMQAHF